VSAGRFEKTKLVVSGAIGGYEGNILPALLLGFIFIGL
jgi:hypothetical protein